MRRRLLPAPGLARPGQWAMPLRARSKQEIALPKQPTISRQPRRVPQRGNFGKEWGELSENARARRSGQSKALSAERASSTMSCFQSAQRHQRSQSWTQSLRLRASRVLRALGCPRAAARSNGRRVFHGRHLNSMRGEEVAVRLRPSGGRAHSKKGQSDEVSRGRRNGLCQASAPVRPIGAASARALEWVARRSRWGSGSLVARGLALQRKDAGYEVLRRSAWLRQRPGRLAPRPRAKTTPGLGPNAASLP